MLSPSPEKRCASALTNVSPVAIVDQWIACDANCQYGIGDDVGLCGEWFMWGDVGLESEPVSEWFCPTCRRLVDWTPQPQQRKKKRKRNQTSLQTATAAEIDAAIKSGPNTVILKHFFLFSLCQLRAQAEKVLNQREAFDVELERVETELRQRKVAASSSTAQSGNDEQKGRQDQQEEQEEEEKEKEKEEEDMTLQPVSAMQVEEEDLSSQPVSSMPPRGEHCDEGSRSEGLGETEEGFVGYSVRACEPAMTRFFEGSAKGDRWVPWSTAVGAHERYISERIYSLPHLSDREKYLLHFVFRGSSYVPLFECIYMPLFEAEGAMDRGSAAHRRWSDILHRPDEAFRASGPLHEAYRLYRNGHGDPSSAGDSATSAGSSTRRDTSTVLLSHTCAVAPPPAGAQATMEATAVNIAEGTAINDCVSREVERKSDSTQRSIEHMPSSSPPRPLSNHVSDVISQQEDGTSMPVFQSPSKLHQEVEEVDGTLLRKRGKLHTTCYRPRPPKGMVGEAYTWYILCRTREFLRIGEAAYNFIEGIRTMKNHAKGQQDSSSCRRTVRDSVDFEQLPVVEPQDAIVSSDDVKANTTRAYETTINNITTVATSAPAPASSSTNARCQETGATDFSSATLYSALCGIFCSFRDIGPTMSKMFLVTTHIQYPELELLSETCAVGDGAEQAFAHLYGLKHVKRLADRERLLHSLYVYATSAMQELDLRLPQMIAWTANATRKKFAGVIKADAVPSALSIFELQVNLCEWRKFLKYDPELRLVDATYHDLAAAMSAVRLRQSKQSQTEAGKQPGTDLDAKSNGTKDELQVSVQKVPGVLVKPDIDRNAELKATVHGESVDCSGMPSRKDGNIVDPGGLSRERGARGLNQLQRFEAGQLQKPIQVEYPAQLHLSTMSHMSTSHVSTVAAIMPTAPLLPVNVVVENDETLAIGEPRHFAPRQPLVSTATEVSTGFSGQATAAQTLAVQHRGLREL